MGSLSHCRSPPRSLAQVAYFSVQPAWFTCDGGKVHARALSNPGDAYLGGFHYRTWLLVWNGPACQSKDLDYPPPEDESKPVHHDYLASFRSHTSFVSSSSETFPSPFKIPHWPLTLIYNHVWQQKETIFTSVSSSLSTRWIWTVYFQQVEFPLWNIIFTRWLKWLTNRNDRSFKDRNIESVFHEGFCFSFASQSKKRGGRLPILSGLSRHDPASLFTI